MTFFAVIWLLIATSTARGLHELLHLNMGESVALGRPASFDAEAPLRRDHISQRAPQTECDPDDDPYCPVPPLSLSTPTPVTSDDYTPYVAPTVGFSGFSRLLLPLIFFKLSVHRSMLVWWYAMWRLLLLRRIFVRNIRAELDVWPIPDLGPSERASNLR
jgi:hypothetical protein